MSDVTPTPFLRLLAQAFVKAHPADLHRVCFVFPNRRSGVFFSKEIAAAAGRPLLSPAITTISDFLADITGAVEVTRTEALFVLYNKYRDIFGDKAEDFDRFARWGDIILNDFNDVDKYLADPKAVFTNVRDLKSISSNYLTKEQVKVIERFFGDRWKMHAGDDSRMWRDPDVYTTSRATDKFFTIWDALPALYDSLNQELDKQGLSYSGRIYRDAAKRVAEAVPGDFPYSLYVFAGFNVLSASEIKVLKGLGDMGIADYYWDCNSPAMNDQDNKATLYIHRNMALFNKPRLDLGEPPITRFPHIEAIGIPSNTGQARYATHILSRLGVNPRNAVNTAIVLPDEALLPSLLGSLPQSLGAVNITMGIPLRQSSIASLINMLAKMHRGVRKNREGPGFFHEDISDIISHPLLKSAARSDTEKIAEYMLRQKRFYLPCDILSDPSSELWHPLDPKTGKPHDPDYRPKLTMLFEPIPDTRSPRDMANYVGRLLDFLKTFCPKDEVQEGMSIEEGFITMYADLLNQLTDTTMKYGLEMSASTFFYLVGRYLATASIAFEGEPMKGLQIMGVLETRCLDFENIILLSMNEKMFPRRHYARSFIPGSLRRAFGLATVEAQDSMYAYYFFRMISRARRVYLIYDARAKSHGTGEHSRYIEQLKVLYPQSGITQRVVNFGVTPPKGMAIEVRKDGRIMERINRYRTKGSRKFLSASVINQYINCPLSFYLQHVEDLKVDDEASEYMDPSMLGTIVHAVLDTLYNGIVSTGDRFVSAGKIERALKDTQALTALINTTINSMYLKVENNPDVLSGETLLVAKAIKYYVEQVLNYDKQLGVQGRNGFYFEGAEKREEHRWTVSTNPDDPGQSVTINFTQFIDRVDKVEVATENGVETVLRIVDYKTGKDRATTSKMSMLFNDASGERPKALLQLMAYCNVYLEMHNPPEPIMPVLYTVRDMNKAGFGINKVSCFDDLNDEFLKEFGKVIGQIFNPDSTFKQAANPKHCQWCKYAAFCHK